MNKKTNAFMVCDTDDKIVCSDEAYSCTTTVEDIGPCGRSVMYMECANDKDSQETVKYGDQIRFVTNTYIF